MNKNLIISQNDSLEIYKSKIIQNSVNHGWTNRNRSLDEIACLIQSEIFELFEEFRPEEPKIIYFDNDEVKEVQKIFELTSTFEEQKISILNLNDIVSKHKPLGIGVELADIVIRILDAEDIIKRSLGYQPGEEYLEFRKIKRLNFLLSSSFFENIRRMNRMVDSNEFHNVFLFCFDFAKEYEIDLLQMVRIKHLYNLTRPYMHGNKRF